MYEVITFGSATKDTFLKIAKENYQFFSKGEKKLKNIKEGSFYFPLGEKIFVERLKTTSGGGATNVAATFSNQGFKVAVFTKVGEDQDGQLIIKDLQRFKKIDLSFIKKDNTQPTSWAVILSLGKYDRTILISRGASHFLKKSELPWENLKNTKWFYIAPLRGRSVKIFEPLINFAKIKKIKVAVNFSPDQIKSEGKKFFSLLGKIELLILNLKEASLLTHLSQKEEKKIIKRLQNLGPKLIVITKGENGSLVAGGGYLFKAPALKKSAIEKTGAGDAFGSGFLSGLLEKNDIEYSLQLATANATSCIQKIGAKEGLLKKDASWVKVEVKKTPL